MWILTFQLWLILTRFLGLWMMLAEKFNVSVRSRMNLLDVKTQTFVVSANSKTLLKIQSVRHLEKFVLGLDTCSTKDDYIYQLLIHVRKITLMGQLQYPVVKCVDVLSLTLRYFCELESGCSKVANWLTEFLKALQDIDDIICLVWEQIEVIVYIFSIWSIHMSNMLILTFPLEMCHIGPSNIWRQDHVNFLNSSKRLSGHFHFGAMGGEIFARLKELYLLIIWKFAGFTEFTGGTSCGGCPPTAPCSCCSA